MARDQHIHPCVEVYQRPNMEWWWRLLAHNRTCLCEGGPYGTSKSATRAARSAIKAAEKIAGRVYVVRGEPEEVEKPPKPELPSSSNRWAGLGR